MKKNEMEAIAAFALAVMLFCGGGAVERRYRLHRRVSVYSDKIQRGKTRENP